jgi:Tfp pilus assembly protein PilF
VPESNAEASSPPESPQQTGRSWLARARRRLRSVFTWKGAVLVLKTFLVGASRIGWAAAGILILATFVQSMTSEIVSIDTISVPHTFADSGFSSDVASQRLRDALMRFTQSTGSSMQSPVVALTSELPKITVPKVDISIDTITTLLRKLLHLRSARNISGEFLLQGDTVWLRLRENGEELFTGTTSGFDPAKIDTLLDAAALNVLRKMTPYLGASATYKDDPDWAFELADGIVSRLPSSDINVQWSLILQGKYFLDRQQAGRAETYLQKAVSLNPKNPAAHFNLAIALENQGNASQAIAEYHRAIEIQPSDALAYNNLGKLLQKQHEVDAAIAELHKAVARDPFNAVAQNNLASALEEKGHAQDAMARYRWAIKLDPNYGKAHYNLGILLRDQGKNEEAMAEFRRAIENSPNDALSHVGLARTLLGAMKNAEALKEYDRALAIDPSNEIARHDRDSLRTYLADDGNK